MCAGGQGVGGRCLGRGFGAGGLGGWGKSRILAVVPKAILRFKRFAGTQISYLRCSSQGNSVFRRDSKIAFSLRFPKAILCFKRFAGTQKSNFRCCSQGTSAFQAFRWDSKIKFPLWFPRHFCVSSVSLALKKSHFRCGSQGNSVFQAFRWNSKVAFPRWFPRPFCVSSVSLALKSRIFGAVPFGILGAWGGAWGAWGPGVEGLGAVPGRLGLSQCMLWVTPGGLGAWRLGLSINEGSSYLGVGAKD